VIDGLMKELGFDGSSLDGLVAGATAMQLPAAAEEPAAKSRGRARLAKPDDEEEAAE
jgi:hypothetical protein